MEKLTLTAVADAMGYTKPAIYHYYHSKEELVRNLVLELLQQESVALISSVSASSGRESVLGTLIRSYYNFYRSRLHAFRLVYCPFQLVVPLLALR